MKPLFKKGQHSKLRKLQCYPQVYEMLVMGFSIPRVAARIHTEFHEAVDMDRGALERALYRLRDGIPPSHFKLGPQAIIKRREDDSGVKVTHPPTGVGGSESEDRGTGEGGIPEEITDGDKGAAIPVGGGSIGMAPPAVIGEKLEALDTGIAELEKLERLYELQMERILMEYGNEKTITKLIPGMAMEMQRAESILTRLLQLKMELGLYDRMPSRHDVRVAGVAQIDISERLRGVSEKHPAIGRALRDEKSRMKILNAVRGLIPLAGPTKPASDSTNGAKSLKNNENVCDDVEKVEKREPEKRKFKVSKDKLREIAARKEARDDGARGG